MPAAEKEQSLSQDKLTIERIEVIPIIMPLPRVFSGSNYYMSHRCTIITRIYTKEGIVGESYNGDEYEGQKEVVSIIEDKLSHQLVGMNAFEVEKCWERSLSATFDILGNRSAAIQAQACLDSAIWDAFGKAFQSPLYRMWGGHRESLPVIAIAGYYEEDKKLRDYSEEMKQLQEMGLGGCKFKIGGKSPREDADRVRAATEGVDDNFRICVDANQGWDLRQAVEFASYVEDLDIMWFEEPCRWYDDRRSMAMVRSITGIPVTAGQSEFSRAGCRDLIMDDAIDYCNFDASWGGGPTEWRRVASLAKCFSVTMAHHEEPQVSAHLLASITNSGCIEVFHPERDPLFYCLVKNRNPFINGEYEVPKGPGWGLELDESIIKKYRAK